MIRLFENLNKIPKTIVPAIGLLVMSLLGFVDYATGYEISFSIFYLLPIMFVSYFSKKQYALIISVLSALVWLMADLFSGHQYSHIFIPFWNTTMRLGFFMIFVFALSTIKHLLEIEQSLARVDYMTGIYNNRAFYELADKEIERADRFMRPYTIAYIDLDNFKQVNDSLGHSAGDDLLHSVAKTINHNIRAIDIVSRLGGDEFAVFMPETDLENAKIAINKIQKILLEYIKKANLQITFSIGVVTCQKSCDLNELIKEADELMYSVKKSGKNRIEYKNYEPTKDSKEKA